MTAPIVGATRLGHLEDALAAEELGLTPEEMSGWRNPTSRIRCSVTGDD